MKRRSYVETVLHRFLSGGIDPRLSIDKLTLATGYSRGTIDKARRRYEEATGEELFGKRSPVAPIRKVS